MTLPLLVRLKTAVANATAIGLQKLETIALMREAAEEIESYERLTSMQWGADMRGVAMWRAANPGNELVLPDRACLVSWMLGQIERPAVAMAAGDLGMVEASGRLLLPCKGCESRVCRQNAACYFPRATP